MERGDGGLAWRRGKRGGAGQKACAGACSAVPPPACFSSEKGKGAGGVTTPRGLGQEREGPWWAWRAGVVGGPLGLPPPAMCVLFFFCFFFFVREEGEEIEV